MINPLLKTFICVAECGSFSKAAESLYISKVAVMKQMDSLEAHLELTLFERTPKGITLTNVGNIIYHQSLQLLQQSSDFLNSIKKTQSKEVLSNTISIGSSMTNSCSLFFSFLDAKNIEYSKVHFTVYSLDNINESQQKKLLDHKEIDILTGTNCMNKDLMKCSFYPLVNLPCSIAVPQSDHLSSRNNLTWNDLDDRTFVIPPRGISPFHDALREDILINHPSVHLYEYPDVNSIDKLNFCAKKGYLTDMISQTITLPFIKEVAMDWVYEVPYGIFVQNPPNIIVHSFLDHIISSLDLMDNPIC
ncbi:MAG: LysR family transcriptional regulator [Lachnospiraceae bacterium]|nr:LysR family transcriptional regulator [Lachnospiraceae bacterium]